MKINVEVEIPEGCVSLYEIGIVMVQTPSGDIIVTHSEQSNVDEDGNIPLLQALGLMEMTKDTMLHPPTDDQDST